MNKMNSDQTVPQEMRESTPVENDNSRSLKQESASIRAGSFNTEQAFQNAKTRLDEAFELYISDTEKPGVRLLLDHLYASRAPASTSASKHGAFDGGLTVHVEHVFRLSFGLLSGALRDMSRMAFDISGIDPDRAALSSSRQSSCSASSLFKVCLIHDMNKIMGIDGSPYYVPNMLKNGSRSAAKPWEISDSASPIRAIREYLVNTASVEQASSILEFLQDGFIDFREGLVSLAVASAISPTIVAGLTPEEKNAVIFHDGAYAGRTGLQGNESMLQIIVHSADMLASRYFC